jgi:hypothetical protein
MRNAFAEDLGEVPGEWLEPTVAVQVLRNARLCVPRLQSGRIVFEELKLPSSADVDVEVIHAFELYCGVGNFYKAIMSLGLQVGFLCDRQLPQWAHPHCSTVDLLTCEARQLVWAFLVIFKPVWVHSGFPCTWWTALCHFTRTSSDTVYRQKRLEALVHVRFSTQVLRWQCDRGAAGSFEQPPACRSYQLSWIENLISSASLMPYRFDSCAWGHRDPVSDLPYKKRQRFNANRDMSSLCRRCQCIGEHERVQGRVASGPCKGMCRSTISGAYPLAMCEAWAQVVAGVVSRNA